jgi:hypothetical protein
MIANLIGGFVTILVGVSLIGPVAQQVNAVSAGPVYNSSNLSQLLVPASSLYQSSTWGASVLLLVPGFFALGILGIGIAVTYSALREAGMV